MESQARRTSLRSSTQKHGQPETQLQQQQQHHDETPSPEAATTNLESTTRESSVLTPATSIGTSTHRPNAQPTASTATSSKTGLGGAPSTTEPTDSLSEVSDDAAPALQPEGSRSSRGKKAKAAALASPKRCVCLSLLRAVMLQRFSLLLDQVEVQPQLERRHCFVCHRISTPTIRPIARQTPTPFSDSSLGRRRTFSTCSRSSSSFCLADQTPEEELDG